MNNPFKDVEDVKMNKFHWKTVLIAGTGSFTDGYDLTSVAIVLGLIAKDFSFSVSSNQAALLTSSALLGTIVGAFLFGYLVNMGRKKFYGFDALILAIGAAAQFFVQDYWQLVAARFVLGIGVGADYVISPLIVAEYANRYDRGKLITFGWSVMWLIGAVTAGLSLLILRNFVSDSSTLWRLVLALGAVPALLVVYFRRRFPETPYYVLRIRGDVEEYKRLMKELGKETTSGDRSELLALVDGRPLVVLFKRYYMPLVIVSAMFFIYGVISYVNILFGPTVLAKQIGITDPAVYQVAMNLAFAIPGSFLNFALVDRVGRKVLLVAGFALMSIGIFAFLLAKGAGANAVTLFLIYGLIYTVASQLPGATLRVSAAEVFPTKLRGPANGIGEGVNRFAAFSASFIFVNLLNAYGFNFTMAVLGAITGAGAVLALLLWETKLKGLEEASGERIAEREVV